MHGQLPRVPRRRVPCSAACVRTNAVYVECVSPMKVRWQAAQCEVSVHSTVRAASTAYCCLCRRNLSDFYDGGGVYASLHDRRYRLDVEVVQTSVRPSWTRPRSSMGVAVELADVGSHWTPPRRLLAFSAAIHASRSTMIVEDSRRDRVGRRAGSADVPVIPERGLGDAGVLAGLGGGQSWCGGGAGCARVDVHPNGSFLSICSPVNFQAPGTSRRLLCPSWGKCRRHGNIGPSLVNDTATTVNAGKLPV